MISSVAAPTPLTEYHGDERESDPVQLGRMNASFSNISVHLSLRDWSTVPVAAAASAHQKLLKRKKSQASEHSGYMLSWWQW